MPVGAKFLNTVIKSRHALLKQCCRLSLICTFLGVQAPVSAQNIHTGQISRPIIAIIIDDIGNDLENGRSAIELPYPLTYSFLPHTPYAKTLAELATDQRKEIMLHLPMQPLGEAAMGPGGLSLEMEREDFLRTLRSNMQAVPNFVGINNHMGSRLTRYVLPMQWLMEEMRFNESLFFVDSFTTSYSIAFETAREYDIPAITRDVFLDHDKDFEKLEFYVQRLQRVARRFGEALAIAHPHRETLLFLEQRLPELIEQGFRIVPVSQLIEIKKRRNTPWRASLSPSRKASKN